MPACAIITCKIRSENKNVTNSGVSYHSFPKEPSVKSKWIDATGRYEWFPSKHATICSKHFTDDDFIYLVLGKPRRLAPNALPSVRLHPMLDLNPVQQQSESGSELIVESSIIQSPRKRKLPMKLHWLQEKIKRQKLTIKKLQASDRRNTKNIADMKTILKDLKYKHCLNDENISILKGTNVTLGELNARLSKNRAGKTTAKFSSQLRTFAVTLHYFSPKAYIYVRQHFDTCLPHPRTIKKWYQSIDGNPGFTKESLMALKLKQQQSDHPILCNLVLDEMAIRRRVEWDGKRFHGYVGIGSNLNTDELSEAKEALVFLVTAINGNWKVPVGYFLVNGVNGEQRKNLVLQCLELLHDNDIQIVSLTCDGCPANISMLKMLGCSLDIKNITSTFSHPITKNDICAFLDPCHMLKLVRNAFQYLTTFIDSEGREIKWVNLENLSELQEKEFFNLANKLRRGHIQFENQKMKVKLASQLLSNSVAEAIDFCENSLNLIEFKNTAGTVNFLKIINNLFDVLNSKSLNQLDFKKPMNPMNKIKTYNFFKNTTAYLQSLTLHNGTRVIESGRKTGFIGFIMCMKSAQKMYEVLIENKKCLFYIPFYKISQDHLELLFCNIRCHGGSNNNPTARQFQSIYKKILVHTELSDLGKGNCLPIEQIEILNCSSAVERINKSSDKHMLNDAADDVCDEQNKPFDEIDEGLYVQTLSQFGDQVVSYISGFVIEYLIRKLECEICVHALIAKEKTFEHCFIKVKDKGTLIYPSQCVILICRKIETIIKHVLAHSLNSPIKSNCNKLYLVTKGLKSVLGMDIFNSINFHQYDQSPTNNHLVDLCKAVMERYIDIRLHYLTKNYNPKVSKRHLFNKQVLFAGQ